IAERGHVLRVHLELLLGCVDLLLDDRVALARASSATEEVAEAATRARPDPEQHEARPQQDGEGQVRAMHHTAALAFQVEQHRALYPRLRALGGCEAVGALR